MFGLLKKKSPAEVLQKKYEKLMKEHHQLSTTSRTESDKKFVEAQEVIKEMDALEKK